MNRFFKFGLILMVATASLAGGTDTDDYSLVVKVIAKVQAKAGKIDELGMLLQSVVAPIRLEPGNLRYELQQSVKEDGSSGDEFVFIERWESDEALAQHLRAETATTLLRKLFPNATETELGTSEYVLGPPDLKTYRTVSPGTATTGQ